MKKEEKWAFIMGFAVAVAALTLLLLALWGAYYLLQEKNTQPKVYNDGLVVPEEIDVWEGLVDGVWTRGPKNAPVNLVEYSDLQCPFCVRHHNTLKKALAEYPARFSWQYKHFPLSSMHNQAQRAAEASECAGEQGAFWSFVDYLFANQEKIDSEIYQKIANRLDLDMADFENCLSSKRYRQKVLDDESEGRSKNVKGTPGNIINGQELKGAIPYKDLKEAIEKNLN